MKSIKIDDETGDWILNEMIEGDDELIQCIKHLFYTRVQEWFLNLNYGFRRDVLEGKKVIESDITHAIHDCIYQEPRVKEVTNLTIDFDNLTRHLSIGFDIIKQDGQVIGGEFVNVIV
jgi:hypothetical protein